MPDGDRIPLGIYGHWRKVFRSLDARDSVKRLADDVVGALASDLRHAGGIVGLGRRGGVVQGAAAAPTVSAEAGVSPASEPADERTGAVALALHDHLALTSSPEATYAMAERLVKGLAWSRFDRMITRLVGDRKYTAPELYARFREVLSDEAIGKLVRRVLRHPTGEGLRAPNRREQKLSTKELLDTDLEGL